MAQIANTKRIRGNVGTQKNPVRLTALLYLREALLAERYEECADVITIAVEFGADPLEIQFLLEDPRRKPRA